MFFKRAFGPPSHLRLAERSFLVFPLTYCLLSCSLHSYITILLHPPMLSPPPPPPISSAYLLSSIHRAPKLSQQLPPLSESEVAISPGPCVCPTCRLRCFPLYRTTLVSGWQQWISILLLLLLLHLLLILFHLEVYHLVDLFKGPAPGFTDLFYWFFKFLYHVFPL